MSPFRIAMWSVARGATAASKSEMETCDMGLVSRCEHQKLPPRQKTNMVSTLRPVPSLICWQIRCLVVIPAGEGLHEEEVRYTGRIPWRCRALVWNTIWFTVVSHSWGPTLTGGGECRGRPQLLISGSWGVPRATATPIQDNLPPLRELCAFFSRFLFFPKFSYFTIFDD